jgi:hypothetical protein
MFEVPLEALGISLERFATTEENQIVIRSNGYCSSGSKELGI